LSGLSSRTTIALIVWVLCSGYLLSHLATETPAARGRDAVMFGTVRDSSRQIHLRTDFASFYYASKASALGLNVYSARVLDSLAARDGVANHVLPYLYPPFLAIVTQPLSRLSPQAAQRVWDGVQVLCISLACALLVLTLPFRSAEVRERSYWLVGSLFTCGALLVFPFGENLAFGQVNFSILLLITAGVFLSINKKRDWLAGAALGAAALIKVTPALVLVPFLVNKRWRVLGGFFGGIALLMLATFDIAGKDAWREFLAFLPNMGYARNVEGGFHPSIVANFSLAGFFMRLLPGEAVTIRLLTPTISVILFAVVLFLHLKKGSVRNELAFIMPYLILMLVASPVTWRHHLVLLVPGVVFILRELWFERRGVPRVAGIGLICLLAALAAMDFQAMYPLFSISEDWRPILTSLNLWFLLMLFAASLLLLKKNNAVQPGEYLLAQQSSRSDS
jgi:alpha-1,2-mannosyltransferase